MPSCLTWVFYAGFQWQLVQGCGRTVIALKTSWRNLYPYPFSRVKSCFWCRSAVGWSVHIIVSPGRDREPRFSFIFREQLWALYWQCNGIPPNSSGGWHGIHSQNICTHEMQKKPPPRCSPLIAIIFSLLFSPLLVRLDLTFQKSQVLLLSTLFRRIFVICFDYFCFSGHSLLQILYQCH